MANEMNVMPATSPMSDIDVTVALIDATPFAEYTNLLGFVPRSASMIVALASEQSDFFWLQSAPACNPLNTASMLIDDRAHPAWFERVAQSPALQNIELALRKVLAEPAIPEGGSYALQPADFIVGAAVTESGASSIAAAWMRNDQPSIAKLIALFLPPSIERPADLFAQSSFTSGGPDEL